MRVLDLGCGNKKRPGAVGVDFNAPMTSAGLLRRVDGPPTVHP